MTGISYTAALGVNASNNNGCVVLAAIYSYYYPNGENLESSWDDTAHFKKVLHSTVNPDIFRFASNTIELIEQRLLKP